MGLEENVRTENKFIAKDKKAPKSKLQLEVDKLSAQIEKMFSPQNHLWGAGARDPKTMFLKSIMGNRLKRLQGKLDIETQAANLEADAKENIRQSQLAETKAMIRAQRLGDMRKNRMEKGGRLGTIKAGF